MVKKIVTAVLAGALIFTPVLSISNIQAQEVISNEVQNSETIAELAITAIGIMTRDNNGSMNYTKAVSRADFTKMLVDTSNFAGKVSSKANVSLFQDVKKGHSKGGYIKVAVSQGWMSGYLGGKFYPDKTVTLEEAIAAACKLLGYENSDFTGNISDAKYEWYIDKELNKNIKLSKNGKMTRKDCMNFLYNLLTADMKDGKIYGETLGYSLDSKGEIDYLKILNKSLKGPIIATAEWRNSIPFSMAGAKIYRDGKESTQSKISIYDVLYYSTKQKTVWAYDNKVYGVLNGVTPDDTAPKEVIISGKTYTIGTQKLAYALSNQGNLVEGTPVVLLLGNNGAAVGITQPREIDAQIIGCVLSKGEHVVTDMMGYDSVKTFVEIVDTKGRIHTIDCDTKDLYEGAMVKVTFEERKEVVTKLEIKNDLDGKVSKNGTVLGTKKIAEDANIIDVVQGEYIKIYPQRLDGYQLSTSMIYYYALDSNGIITDLILNDVTGDLYEYGVLINSVVRDTYIDPTASFPTGKSGTFTMDVGGKQYTYNSEYAYFSTQKGPKAFLVDGQNIRAVREMNNVPISAINERQIISSKDVYKIADDVLVYLEKNQSYYISKLSNVSDTKKYTLTGYVDYRGKNGGQVRIIIAKEHVRKEVQ